MSDISLRPATPEDAEAICRIYNQGIEDRIATLETDLRTPEERRGWMATRDPRHPVIMVQANGQVVGWASLNPFNPRRADDHVADLSVYAERGWRGRGVGRRLLERLIVLAREIGYHKMVLAALPFNLACVALYERCGFTRVGVYREQGMLDGGWVDVLIMEKLLEQAAEKGPASLPAASTAAGGALGRSDNFPLPTVRQRRRCGVPGVRLRPAFGGYPGIARRLAPGPF